MSAANIAKQHLNAALAEAKAKRYDPDAVLRGMLGLVVAKYLETRTPPDVQTELRFVADNCDPDTDHAFMRP